MWEVLNQSPSVQHTSNNSPGNEAVRWSSSSKWTIRLKGKCLLYFTSFCVFFSFSVISYQLIGVGLSKAKLTSTDIPRPNMVEKTLHQMWHFNSFNELRWNIYMCWKYLKPTFWPWCFFGVFSFCSAAVRQHWILSVTTWDLPKKNSVTARCGESKQAESGPQVRPGWLTALLKVALLFPQPSAWLLASEYRLKS